MSTPRILVGTAWLASIAAAYFIGDSGDFAKNSATAPAPGSTSPVAISEKTSSLASHSAGTSDDATGAKRDIPTIIAQARLQMGGGMGGMMNIRAMLRAIAPIARAG